MPCHSVFRILKENHIVVFIYTSLIFFRNRKIVLLAGWALLLFLTYKVSKTDREYQEYNPYEVLNLDPVSSILYSPLKIFWAHSLKEIELCLKKSDSGQLKKIPNPLLF